MTRRREVKRKKKRENTNEDEKSFDLLWDVLGSNSGCVVGSVASIHLIKPSKEKNIHTLPHFKDD